jgi:hypothetical protein
VFIFPPVIWRSISMPCALLSTKPVSAALSQRIAMQYLGAMARLRTYNMAFLTVGPILGILRLLASADACVTSWSWSTTGPDAIVLNYTSLY